MYQNNSEHFFYFYTFLLYNYFMIYMFVYSICLYNNNFKSPKTGLHRRKHVDDSLNRYLNPEPCSL